MGIRKAPKYKFLDLAHRGVVVTCIGLTLYGSYMLGHRVYRYFTVIKPNRQLEEKRILEELNAMDSSALVDNAPKLSN
ncbi:hypothetical protein PVAND_002524 [Polypedilum vanderplanki]|uniref:Uncharacterized protein n=1 Tax=Polypedilum vanderplanki TaxID=319348 RepID=A0A9J6BR96_POLVA|nr:hypothetical protein PVAND_002524 [Polypedilum vanderplanki]